MTLLYDGGYMKQEQPQWQLINMLPVFNEMIDSVLPTGIKHL